MFEDLIKTNKKERPKTQNKHRVFKLLYSDFEINGHFRLIHKLKGMNGVWVTVIDNKGNEIYPDSGLMKIIWIDQQEIKIWANEPYEGEWTITIMEV